MTKETTIKAAGAVRANHRLNYQRTTALLLELRTLVEAAWRIAGDDTMEASLLEMANGRFDLLDAAREMEWAGIGGAPTGLSPADAALATGEGEVAA